MLLSYPFDAIPNRSSGPFGTKLPSSACSSLAGERSPLRTRCLIPGLKLPNIRSLPLPFRTSVLPDRSAQRRQGLGQLTFAISPISLRSPWSDNFLSFSIHGSSFQFRYCPPSSLLFEPLGTRTIMQHIVRGVKC